MYPIREATVLAGQAALAAAQIEKTAGESATTTAWLVGMLDALRWLAGEAELAPMTLRTIRAGHDAAAGEMSAAIEVVYAPDGREDVLKARAEGVDRVLQWALNRDGAVGAPLAWAVPPKQR